MNIGGSQTAVRGRTRHDPSGASVYRRIAEAAQFRHPVYGARELFERVFA